MSSQAVFAGLALGASLLALYSRSRKNPFSAIRHPNVKTLPLRGFADFPTDRLEPLKDTSKTPVVVVFCGSFSPITFMHLRLLEMTKDYFQQSEEFELIGGYISPVADGYGKKSLVTAIHRVKMCQFAANYLGWPMVSTYEAKSGIWIPTRIILDKHEEKLNDQDITSKYTNGKPIKVLFLSGADLIDSFLVPNLWASDDLEKILGYYGIIVVERFGTPLEEIIRNSSIISKYRENMYILSPTIQNDLSSTKMRELIKCGLSIKCFLPNECIEYIEEHGLYK